MYKIYTSEEGIWNIYTDEEGYMRYSPRRRDSAGAPRRTAVGRPNPDEKGYIEIYPDEEVYVPYSRRGGIYLIYIMVWIRLHKISDFY